MDCLTIRHQESQEQTMCFFSFANRAECFLCRRCQLRFGVGKQKRLPRGSHSMSGSFDQQRKEKKIDQPCRSATAVFSRPLTLFGRSAAPHICVPATSGSRQASCVDFEPEIKRSNKACAATSLRVCVAGASGLQVCCKGEIHFPDHGKRKLVSLSWQTLNNTVAFCGLRPSCKMCVQFVPTTSWDSNGRVPAFSQPKKITPTPPNKCLLLGSSFPHGSSCGQP